MKTIQTQPLRPAYPVMVDDEDEEIPDFIFQDPDAAPVAGKYDEYFLKDEWGQLDFPSCFAERL